MRLTAAGELLLEYARNVENEVQRTRSAIEALKGVRKGQIRLGVPESFTHHFLPGFLAKFRSRYPEITFDAQMATTPGLLEMLVAGELDVTLTFNAILVPGVKVAYHRILATCVLVPNGHPLAGRESLRLKECADYPWALPDAAQGTKRLYDELLAKAKISPGTALTSNSYELIRSSSIAGLALSLVTEPLRRSERSQPTHTYIPLREPRATQTCSVVVRRGRNLPVAVQTFIDALRAELEGLEEERSKKGNRVFRK